MQCMLDEIDLLTVQQLGVIYENTERIIVPERSFYGAFNGFLVRKY